MALKDTGILIRFFKDFFLTQKTTEKTQRTTENKENLNFY
jgi:hypothetical protein